MKTTRLEAFSDGVIAIIITIMVLEFKVPEDASPAALAALWPVLVSYAVSYALVAIYWVNHHHLIHLARRADRAVLWTNALWLFWLSLIPFVTAYHSTHRSEPLAAALYGADNLLCALSFAALAAAIARQGGEDARLASLHRTARRKGLAGAALCLASVPLAWVSPWLAIGLVLLPALLHFLPDGRIEEVVEEPTGGVARSG
jgi:uncharacterized membrane protein